MDWSNESYVRLFVRDTKTWILLGWEGQCVLSLSLRKMDRAGVMADVFDAADLAVMLANGMPVEIVDRGLKRLVDRSVVEITAVGLVMPNYIEAQEAAMSDKQRKKEQRDRRLAISRNGTDESRNVTKDSRNVPIRSQVVTSSHSASQVVTLNSADLNSADLKIPPNPPGGPAVVRDPTRPKPADPFRASFKTQCPDLLDFTEPHRQLCKRGSIDLNLEWRAFSRKAQSNGVHKSDWSTAFEAHLAEACQRIQRAAAIRATERNPSPSAVVAAPAPSRTHERASETSDPRPPPKPNPDAMAKLTRTLGAIGG